MNTSAKRRKLYALVKRDGTSCFWCGVQTQDGALTLDHLVPVSKGGSHHLSNLVLACQRCNEKRGNKYIGQSPGFMRRMAELKAVAPIQVRRKSQWS